MEIMNGAKVSRDEISAQIASVDYDDDGEVNFEEFVVLMVKKMYELQSVEEELVQVFNQFDMDKDGDIGQEDLMCMMQQLGNTNFNL